MAKHKEYLVDIPKGILLPMNQQYSVYTLSIWWTEFS